MLSPLLSGLQPEEQLTAEMAIAPGGVTVGLRGSAHAPSPEEAAERAAHLGRLLQALVRSQFPGFVLRPIEAGDGLPSELGAQSVLRPAGRALSVARRSKPELGPVAVESREADLILPAMRFSAEGLSAAVELLKAELQHAVMRLNMRLVRFDAALLRRLASLTYPLAAIPILQTRKSRPDSYPITASPPKRWLFFSSIDPRPKLGGVPETGSNH
jgi:hypothetical protein